jgi:transcriptional regulator with XRE-family HTH domain
MGKGEHPGQSPPEVQREYPIEREIFARNFKAAREAAGLSLRDIHERTGIGYAYLSRVENCLQNVGLDNMAILAATVGKPLYKLLKPVSR